MFELRWAHGWESRAHFIAIAAQVMRHLLVDHARARRAGKRGGEQGRVVLDEAIEVADERGADLVAIDEALRALERLDGRQARIVEMRYFGGLSIEEAAEVLGVSSMTVKRDWATAKLRLKRGLSRKQ